MARRHVPLFVAFGLLGSGLGMAVLAAPVPHGAPIPPDLSAERQALTDAKRDAALATERARQLQRQAGAERDEARRVGARAAAVAARIQAAEAEIAAADAQIAIVGALQAQQRARLAERQAPALRLTAALQTMARRPPALALAQPGSITDIVHLRALLGVVLPAVRNRTGALRAEVANGQRLRAAADAGAAGRRAAQADLQAQRHTLAGLEADHRLRATRLETGAALEQDRAIALGEEARDLVGLMQQLNDDAIVRRRLEALPAPLIRPAQPGAAGRLPPAAIAVARTRDRLPYRLPVVGRLVSGLGEMSGTGVRARGITIATRAGAQIVAPADGHVRYAGRYRGFGTILILDHGDGWMSLLTHLDTVGVAVGDVLVQGAPVGRAGPGRPKVTVELRRNGQPVDIGELVSSG